MASSSKVKPQKAPDPPREAEPDLPKASNIRLWKQAVQSEIHKTTKTRNVFKKPHDTICSDQAAFIAHTKLISQNKRENFSTRSPIQYFLYEWTLSPESTLRRTWDFLTALFVLFICWWVPFVICFHWIDEDQDITLFFGFLEAWFIVDLFLNFITGYYDHGVLIMDRKQIALHYVGTWFPIDFLAAIPIGSLLKVNQKAFKVFKYAKIPKMLRFGTLIKQFRRHLKYAAFGIVMLGLLFLVHVCACVWTLVVNPCPEGCKGENTASLYWTSVHYSLTILFGTTNNALYERESIFCAAYHAKERPSGILPRDIVIIHNVISLLGILCIAIVSANVIFVAQSWSRAGNAFRKKMDMVSNEMDYLKMPRPIRRRVKQYYDYVWNNNKTMEGELILLNDSNMSISLKTAISKHMYSKLIMNTPLFQNASDALLEQACRLVRTIIYMPGDIITRKGSIDFDIYIIFRGTVEVVGIKDNAGNPQPVFLSTGSAFGELAALVGTRRSCSIQACTVTELCVISKDTVDALMCDHPAFCSRLEEYAIEQYRIFIKREGLLPFDVETKVASFAKKVQSELNSRKCSRGPKRHSLTELFGNEVSVESFNESSTSPQRSPPKLFRTRSRATSNAHETLPGQHQMDSLTQKVEENFNTLTQIQNILEKMISHSPDPPSPRRKSLFARVAGTK